MDWSSPGGLKDTSRISPWTLLAWAGGKITPATVVSCQELFLHHMPQGGLGKDLAILRSQFAYVENQELRDSKCSF